MNHDGLAADLAGHLRGERRMAWRDVQLGPSGSPRPDVYAIFKSYAHPTPMAYECKVSRADLLADVTSGKWQTYLAYACGVVFAMEAELAKGCRELVPAHAGLIVRGERWRMAKRPVLSPVTIPQDALLKLLIDGVEREGPRYRSTGWNKAEASIRKAMGKDVAAYVLSRERARIDLESAQNTVQYILDRAHADADRIRKEAFTAAVSRRELAAVLGLPENADMWEIAEAIRELRERTASHPAEQQLRRLTDSLRVALERHGWKPQPEVAEVA